MPAAGLIPLFLVVAADVWVFIDARVRQGTDREVSATVAAMEIDTPQAWLAWCVVLFLVFFPVYLVARRASS